MLKKIVAILLGGLLLMGLISCAAENAPAATEGSESSAVESESEETTSAPSGNPSNPLPPAQEEEEDLTPKGEPTKVALNSSTKGIKVLGERELKSDSQINCDWTCSGIEFVVNSNGGPITFEADASHPAYYRAYVDGKSWVDVNGKNYFEVIGKSEVSLKYVPEGRHTIRFIKVTGHTLSRSQLYSVTCYGTIEETAPADKELYIEFIGDSISCGWGVIGNHDGTYTAQDGSLAYPYMLAEKMNADYAITALSGQGIISGSLCTVMAGYVRSSPLRDMSAMYEFERKADIVVINIGTNDFSNREKDDITPERFQGVYEELLRTIKEKNGSGCEIVCLYNTMNDTFASSILAACQALGGENAGIFTYQMKKASSGHPTIAENQTYLQALEPVVRNAYDPEPPAPMAAITSTPSGYGMSVGYSDESWKPIA